MNDLTLTLQPIAVIHTPYKEKFSVPRQPDLVQDGIGIVELLPPYNSPEAVRGLEQFRIYRNRPKCGRKISQKPAALSEIYYRSDRTRSPPSLSTR